LQVEAIRVKLMLDPSFEREFGMSGKTTVPIADDVPESVLVEYQEAAKSYANGVDIGFTSCKNLLVINSVFAAIYQTSASGVSPESSLAYLQNNVPYLGMLLAVFLALCVKPYFRHLNNCLLRCSELEAKFDGKLFTRNLSIGNRRVNTSSILFTMSAVIFCGWLLMSGLYKHNIGYLFDIFNAFGGN
jgi:hypothetical protein